MVDAPEETAPAPRARERGFAACLAALALALGVWHARIGWRAWLDVAIDFGRELYVPWRIAEGEVLYRDMAYFNGPLSPYVNALWFHLGGVGYSTLALANGLVFALFSALLWRLLARLSSRVSAGLALAFIVPSLGLAHIVRAGNYNFLSPYSHELTHGLLLAVLLFGALAKSLSAAPRPARFAWPGFLLGLVFLTKAELFLAAALGALGVLALALARRAAAPRDLAVLGAAACLPYAAAVLALAAAMPAGQAALGALGSWPGIVAGRASELEFYRYGMGLDAPGENLALLFSSAGLVAAFLAPGALLERAGARSTGRRALLALLLGVGTYCAWHFGRVAYWRLARPLPLFALAIAGWAVAQSLRGRALAGVGSASSANTWILRAGFALFALALLAKMALRSRFEHYGFALALPALALGVMAAADWLPSALRRPRGASPGWWLAASAAGILAADGLTLWRKSAREYAAKDVVVGAGADRFRADVRGEFVGAAVAEIEARTHADERVLVLPEGIMINYLARRRTPTPYLNFMPPEIVLYGEDAIVAALAQAPPDAIVLLHKDTSEYGFALFGSDYGKQIEAWIRPRYAVTWMDERGHPPLQAGSLYGVALLEPAR